MLVLTRGGSHDVEPRQVDVPRASPSAAAAALASFVDGVGSRDGEALAALGASSDAEAGDLLAGIAKNAEALDLRAVTARYVDQVGAVAADGSWTGIVELTWQFGGFDAVPAEADVAVSFAPDGDALGIVGFEATGRARVPLWLRGQLSVSRADGVVVLADGSQAAADAVRQRVVRGIGVVDRVLPDRISSVVVEVPGSAADLDETLGAEPGTYAGIAAVTAFAGSSTADDAPVHVFVNPEVTAGLRRAGAQVVMSHELVHVATDATRRSMEPWLLEGFADYVALRDAALPDRVVLGRAIAAVRREGVPDGLPAPPDFDTRAEDLQASYEEAWLACRIIARRLGEAGLVAVYDDASRRGASTGPEAALRRSGLPLAAVLREWQAKLHRLAR
ncbi:hypothetical protein ACS3YM_10490 [Nocardia sp. N13]|uniref:hypothetical protein n=1 Tax=Nocardioides sp. N13(2025) TaxID=3453405 RepID=UPI003F76D003